jgi:hypothetical protein
MRCLYPQTHFSGAAGEKKERREREESMPAAAGEAESRRGTVPRPAADGQRRWAKGFATAAT